MQNCHNIANNIVRLYNIVDNITTILIVYHNNVGKIVAIMTKSCDVSITCTNRPGEMEGVSIV